MRLIDKSHKYMVMDEDEEEQYNRYWDWRGYKSPMAWIFNAIVVPAVVFVGVLLIAFSYLLFLIDYPEPINISLFGIP